MAGATILPFKSSKKASARKKRLARIVVGGLVKVFADFFAPSRARPNVIVPYQKRPRRAAS
jgi:hypothetical protein